MNAAVQHNATLVKSKIRQLYSFLKEANQLRYRPIRLLKDQVKVIRIQDMPKHPSMQWVRPLKETEGAQEPDVLLRITRPVLTRCPPPPPELIDWLLSGWDDPKAEPVCLESRNAIGQDGDSTTVEFDASQARIEGFSVWKSARSAWVVPELLARQALQCFELFYDLYATLEKDRGELELIAGDGHLFWQAQSVNDGSVQIHHPVLLKRVQLQFDPTIPEFTVLDTDRSSEIYSSLFVDLANISSDMLRARIDELSLSAYHPYGLEDSEAFLRALVQSISPTTGSYTESAQTASASNAPVIYREPVLFLRRRQLGLANAVNSILDDIETRELFPPALAQITGTTEAWSQTELAPAATNTAASISHLQEIGESDILLANEANAEQLKIIRRLAGTGSVIVQGPPGTGKTHTIGNIIGHLLSHGKSILVTSHTTKALRVLREKVPDTLRPLCVSVLGDDRGARQQLELAIGAISERLTGDQAEQLFIKSKSLASHRADLLGKRDELLHKRRKALENEYKDVVVGEERLTPSNAARFVASNKLQYSWLPGPVKPGAALPLSLEDVTRLYSLQTQFTRAEELDARLTAPALEKLPDTQQFKQLVDDYNQLLSKDLSHGQQYWANHDRPSASIGALAERLHTEFSAEYRQQAWRPYAIIAGKHAGTGRMVWEKLLQLIDAAVEANDACALQLHLAPSISSSISPAQQVLTCSQIVSHLKAGGKLNFVQLMARGEWKQLINTASVAGARPSHLAHFEALAKTLNLVCRRNELNALWDSLIGRRTARLFAELGESPEYACRSLIKEIKKCLEWHERTWSPLAKALVSEGLALESIISTIPTEASEIADFTALEMLAVQKLPRLLESEVSRRRLRECETGFSMWLQSIQCSAGESADQGVAARLAEAVRTRDTRSYAAGLEYAIRIKAVKTLANQRNALLSKVKDSAREWATQIYRRVSPHDKDVAPGDIEQAWKFRQLHDELQERDRLDPHRVQEEIDALDKTLRDVTQNLIDTKAWANQLRRLENNASLRQALVGWLDTAKRLLSTRQLARRQVLLAESRSLMAKCSDAVPVWIMPISLVAENFDPRVNHFDVVIVDEASQADLNALIPLYMGNQVIVVGDHEQVTPLGVGQDATVLGNLQQTLLGGIPNSHLFDNQSSIYDIARQSFGDAVRLVEHFRCVPDIIAFSNALSYQGMIKPLREANSTNIKPACVSTKVEGIRRGDVNEVEAKKIVSLIKAMINHEAYRGKSIGVISMLKEAQAFLIQSLLQKEIKSVELESRRIQAGIASDFQGDERDIIFISMVDSQAEAGTLRLTGDGAFELTKKRYNVAASRARDQLWVVHSFDVDLHLQSKDLRYKLLSHVRDPSATVREFEQEVKKADSPFEVEVLRRLAGSGYQVKAQWQVGYFKIDLVVEGKTQRLAIECDGDRFHPLEKLSEDIERQTILERLGWQFVRIRGTAFYRDPVAALQPVFSKLSELGIEPMTSGVDGRETKDRVVDELLQRAQIGEEKDLKEAAE